MNITPRTGLLVSIHSVNDDGNLMIINKSGIAINIALSDIRSMGRLTQGIRLIKLNKNDEIADARKIEDIT